MTMQQVGVRAVAEGTGRYVSDANQINDATARIGRTAETTARSSTTLADSLRNTGARMREAGAQAILLGGALAAPGILAARAAANLETSFTQIETLVGVAADKVAEFKQGVFELSGETARSPQELAAALFVVTSAGIRGAEAMDVLAAAAKASAAGLGDTSTIARSVTSAVQAFAKQNLSAGQATDVLLATVREGNLVASDLAGSLSRVLGPAAQLGVQFADLGGFVATFTRLGGDSAEATTALRGIFATLIKPTSGAAKALEDVGLSIAGLREQIQTQGLAQTLVTLIDSFEGNDEALAQVIPNIRALTGVLNTAGVQSDEFIRIQGSIRDSLGATDEAFGRTTEDVAFKFQQALQDLRNEFLKLGEDVLPVLSQLVSALDLVARGFAAVPGPVKIAAFAFITLGGLALVAVGTLGILAGSALSLIALFPALTGGALTASGAIALLGSTLAAVALPVTAAVVAFAALGYIVKTTLDEASREADSFSKDTREAMEGGAAAIFQQRQEWIDLRDAIQADIDTFKAAGKDTSDLEEQVTQLNADIDDLTSKLNIQSDALADDANAMEAGRGAAADFQSAQAGLAGQVDETTAKIRDQVTALYEQRAAAAINAAAAQQVQQQITDQQEQAAGRGGGADFLGGGLGLLTPQEQDALRKSTADFFSDRAKAAAAATGSGGGGGGGQTAASAIQSTQQRQIREQVEALLSGGEPGLQKTIRTQRQLDSEFAKFAETLRTRFGVQVPEIFRDMFDDIRKKALEAGQEVPNDLGNLLSFLVARRLGRGLPGGAGLISVPPAAAAAAGGGAGGQTITIGQINVGAGTTTGDIAQGVGAAARSTFGSQ